ncbi:MAG: SiaB family protein kinase [Bacteroidota bacterium]
MSIYEIFNSLKSDNLSFMYKGQFSDTITDRIVNLIEENISNNLVELSSLKKKVPFLMIECFQNIVRHAVALEDEMGFFMIRNIGCGYFITSGNGLMNINIPILKTKLEKINSLNKEELKEYYLEILNNEEVSKDGGSGLGLIEMARKSGQKIEFAFYPINDTYSLFYVQIKIKSNEDQPKESTSLSDEISTIQDATVLHKNMRDNNVLLIQQGDFSQETLFSILTMVENNLNQQADASNKNKEIYHVLVELMQNITKYAYSSTDLKKGIFTVSKDDNCYQISSGNYISINEIAKLKEHLDQLNSLNKDGLKTLYQKVLKGSNEASGLGMIDLARLSPYPLEYNFYQENDNLTFFELTVKI